MGARLVLGSGLLCAVLWPALPLRAQGPKAPALNWVRTAGADACISAYELADRVEERLGKVVFVGASEAELYVDGYVAPHDTEGAAGYQVQLQVSDRAGRVLGERSLTFRGDDCHVIDETVVIVIAVTLYPDTEGVAAGIELEPDTAASLEALFGEEPTDLDPQTLPTAKAGADAGESEGAASRATRPPPAHASEPSPVVDSEAGGRALGVDAVALGGLGQIPGIAAGLGGVVHLGLGSWAVEAGLGVWLTNEASGGGGDAAFSLLHGSLAVCPWRLSGAARLCTGLELGRLRVAPRNFEVTAEASEDLTASLFAGAVYRPVLAGPLRARLAAVVLLPLVQRGYSYQSLDGGSALLFRNAQLAARLELGLGMQF